jgi:hypothetical protein
MNFVSKRLFTTCLSPKDYINAIIKTQNSSSCHVESLMKSDEFNYAKYIIKNFNLKNFEQLERCHKIFKYDRNFMTSNNINIKTTETFSGLKHYTKVLQLDFKDNRIVVGNYIVWDAHVKLVQSFSNALICVNKKCIYQLNDQYENQLPFEVERSIFDHILAAYQSDFELKKTVLAREILDNSIRFCEPHWFIRSNA